MLAYIIRRSLYAIPIVLGVNILLFALFFLVYSPDRIAEEMIGGKNVTRDQIERWKRDHNYHLDTFLNDGFDRLASASNRPDAPVERTFVELDPDTGRARRIHFDGTGLLVMQERVQPGDYRVRLRVVREGASGTLTVSLPALDGDRIVVTPPADPPVTTGDDALTADRPAVQVPTSALGEGLWLSVPRETAGRLMVHAAGSAAEPVPDDGSAVLPRIEVELYRVESLSIVESLTRTIFWQKGVQLLWFDFGLSDQRHTPIGYEIRQRMMPSLQITVPMFLLSLVVNVVVAMLLAFWRGTWVDHWGTVLCVLGMSISILLFIVAGQIVLGAWLKWFPMSGFEPLTEVSILGVSFMIAEAKYLVLPVLIGVVAGAGSSIRFYRTIFLEEINRDYIRTARAKGLGEVAVLFRHGLKNAMIPILTSVVMTIPFLFMGSLLLENFYGIPGLGAYLIDAITNKDFAVVRAMVFLGSVLYVIALVLTDISYTLVDPRIRLN